MPSSPRAVRGRAPVTALLAVALLAAPGLARAVTFPCSASTNCTEDAQTGCTIFESRADGVRDYYYYRLPDSYDKTKAYPLLLWFHAMGQTSTSPSPNDDCIISSANIMKEMANGGSGGLGAKDMIVLGLAQRGPESFLGDFCRDFCPTPAPDDQAAKADMLELINQLVSRFRISYVIAAGSSMGGYVALRLAQLTPDQVHVLFASAPALHRGRVDALDPGQNGPGSDAVDAALQAGLYDQKLVFDLIGLADDNYTDIVLHNQTVSGWMSGKPWFDYGEEQGVPHVNHFSDDYLCLDSGGFRSPLSKWPPLCDDAGGRKPFLQNVAYGCQDPSEAACGFSDPFTTGRLWDRVREWETAHPAIATGELWPPSAWEVPDAAGWYLEDTLFALGDKDPGSVPIPPQDGGVPQSDGGVHLADGAVIPDGGLPLMDSGEPYPDSGYWIDDAGELHPPDDPRVYTGESGGCVCRAHAGSSGAGLPGLLGLLLVVALFSRRRHGG